MNKKFDEVYELYGQMDGWTEREVILLALGRDPQRPFKNKREGKSVYDLNKIEGYERMKTLVLRAAIVYGWHGYIYPKDFIKWADARRISIPARLKETVEKVKPIDGFEIRKQPIGVLEDRERKHFEEMVRKSEKEELAYYRGIYSKERIQKIEQGTAEYVHPKAKTSLLKIIAGVAVDKFGYDPNDTASNAASKIQSCVERAGLTIDDDTIRRWLREARALLADPK